LSAECKPANEEEQRIDIAKNGDYRPFLTLLFCFGAAQPLYHHNF